MTTLANWFLGRPETHERNLFLTSLGNADSDLHDIFLKASSALLEDGDVDGATLCFRIARPTLAAGHEFAWTSQHDDLLTYCRERQHPFYLVPKCDVAPMDELVATSSRPSYICGLPGGWVAGQSYGPTSHDGTLFWERSVFNVSRAQEFDSCDRYPSIASASRARLAFRVSGRSKHGPAILIGDSTNFGHWLLSFMARMALVDQVPELRQLPVVVGKSSPRFVYECLDLMGYGPDRQIRLGHCELAQFEMLWVPTMLFCGLRDSRQIYWSPECLNYVRARLGANSATDPRSKVSRRRLMISRGTATRRRMLNEDAVYQALRPLGFELVDPSTMSMREQVDAASSAECIVGACGASMALSYLAPPESKIIEMAFPGLTMMVQRPICAALSQDYRCVQGRTVRNAHNNLYDLERHQSRDDFIVDPSKVSAAVNEAISS